MIDEKWARHFAAEWIAVWNSRELDQILAHYADSIVFHSPRIAVVMGEPVDVVSGKERLARYWGKALSLAKDLHFELDRIYIGSDSLAIAYRNQSNQHVVETFIFNAERLVVESIAAYA